MTARTITLTSRPPVKIEDDDWPVLANASDEVHDGQVKSQASRISIWWIKVRQHEDGRAIVYAGYSYTTSWQGGRSLAHKHGHLLPASSDAQSICDAVLSVARYMADGEHYGDDGQQWKRLGDECIADMPAEELPSVPDPSEWPAETLEKIAQAAMLPLGEETADIRILVANKEDVSPLVEHDIVYFARLRDAYAHSKKLQQSRTPYIIEACGENEKWVGIETWTPTEIW